MKEGASPPPRPKRHDHGFPHDGPAGEDFYDPRKEPGPADDTREEK